MLCSLLLSALTTFMVIGVGSPRGVSFFFCNVAWRLGSSLLYLTPDLIHLCSKIGSSSQLSVFLLWSLSLRMYLLCALDLVMLFNCHYYFFFVCIQIACVIFVLELTMILNFDVSLLLLFILQITFSKLSFYLLHENDVLWVCLKVCHSLRFLCQSIILFAISLKTTSPFSIDVSQLVGSLFTFNMHTVV